MRGHFFGRWALRVAPTVVLAVALLWTMAAQREAPPAAPHRDLADLAQTRLRVEAESAEAYVRAAQAGAEGRVKELIGQHVDQAHQILTALWRDLKDRLPRDDVAAILREALRDARFFNGRGYYFIDTLDGLCVLLPTAPSLEGTSLWDNRDDQGTYIMRRLVDAARQPEGGGYVHYRWYSPESPQRMSDKIAYARLFEPLDWVIGAGEYTEVMESTLRAEALTRLETVHFTGNGGIGIIDRDGTPLLFPEAPGHRQRQGGDQARDLSTAEKAVLARLITQAQSGGGPVVFDWDDPGTGRPTRRAAYVQPFTTWGWTIYASAQLEPVAPAAAPGRQDLVPLLPWLALVALVAAVILTRPREEAS